MPWVWQKWLRRKFMQPNHPTLCLFPTSTSLNPTPNHTHSAPFSLPRLPIKRLTPTKMSARREKGLCFNYDDRFVPDHHCKPPQFLCLLVDDLDQPSDNITYSILDDPPIPVISLDQPPLAPDDTSSISLHALDGRLFPPHSGLR